MSAAVWAASNKYTKLHNPLMQIALFIGSSLSKPHTSGSALRKCVYVLACLRPYTINFKWAHSNTSRRLMIRSAAVSCPACACLPVRAGSGDKTRVQRQLPQLLWQQNRSHRVTYNFIFAWKVQSALHEWLKSFLSLARFHSSRSYGHQILSQQQAIIDLYLREISSPQNSCTGCNIPFSSLLRKSCGNIFWFPYLANFGILDYL